MKWTTSNLKNPNYNENHELYVGTSTGSFKSELQHLLNHSLAGTFTPDKNHFKMLRIQP